MIVQISLIKDGDEIFTLSRRFKIPHTRLPNNPATASKKADAQIIETGHSGANGTDAVMISFQATMLSMTNNFLQAQQQVMLAYLNCRSAPSSMSSAHQSGLPILQTHYQSTQAELPTVFPIQEAEAPFDIAQVNTPAATCEVKFNALPARIEPESIAIGAGQDQIGVEAPKSAEELISAFIGLVSERTGYPAEMLDPALDLESDLGIDSIKRVEILSNFRKLLPESWQEKFEGDLEEIGGLRTLDAISEWIRKIPL